ncbi:MAG: FAD-binding oxidoreductase, partial [Hyphomonas sp.]|uniref:FAD-binding oxidoreductase n=1 Tax=Hyphomonas sp. TaxID=87 RepID=UPI00349FD77E
MADDLTAAVDLAGILRQMLGADAVDDDPGTRSLYSQDIWSKGEMAEFIVRPASVDDLGRVAAAAHRYGVALNPRGGGMSYTNGYTPDRGGVAILDFSRLDRITEINVQDMYVTAEAGVTWKQLHDALKP